ncbi:hypothetical protein AJ78_08564 [Emergomyces pasteurianus Ep9510]|uniref:peptidylprolyl isomerase n=1 Tax=Emergomyces pasteurianus Ep9510 TaxID=1447872 RepID=A0A1J9Q2C1_9EURO|nr:hypothetical protein AJ78_08564 [Emergomyces pasteurianus Ep9510]
MGVTKRVLKNGNGVNKPVTGDEVVINYTGCLYDPTAADKYFMGDEFDSSKDRGDFKTTIGIGKVIRGTLRSPTILPIIERMDIIILANFRLTLGPTHEGWDEAVMNMTLGEKSILTISG